MELRKKMKGIIINIIIIFVLFPIPKVFGDWMGPVEVVIGSWGSSAKQFGKDQQDSGTFLPREFGVDQEGIILIADKVNNRIQLFKPDGSLYTIINRPMEIKDNLWPWTLIIVPDGNSLMAELTIVDYAGSILKKVNIKRFERYASPNGYIIYDVNKKNYNRYSPTGQLLKTYKERPLELGVVKEKSSGSKRYKVTIKYPDKEWVVISKGACSRYVRDLNCNLYCPGHRQVIKYDEDGNEAARLTMPKRIADEFPGVGPGAEAEIYVKEEYGPPVVSPNGDVYAWKRTPDTYSIVKWTWQGPKHAPQSLKVASSKTGLHLTWEPPIYETKYVKEYEIVRSDVICGPFALISTVSKNTLKYEDKDVSEGTNYCYKVSAVRASGSSEYSNKAAGKISVSQTTSLEVTGDTYLKVEKDILAGKTIHTAKLHSFNKNELKLLRNTIFAKYGRSFKSDMLKNWFAKKGWYNVDPNYSDNVLTNTDKKNITTFLNLEKKK